MTYRITKEQGIKLLKEYGTPEHVIRHCTAVTDAAVRIGCALNEAGYNMDIGLIEGAGILHDIARVEDEHWIKGGEIARKMGLADEAAIIDIHMHYPSFNEIENADETDMVCLGDRIVKEDSFVGLDERIYYVIEKARKKGADKKVIDIILEKKQDAARFIKGIEEKTGKSLEEIVLGKDK